MPDSKSKARRSLDRIRRHRNRDGVEEPLSDRGEVGWDHDGGPAHAEPTRVPTVSFVREGMTSRDIALKANALGLGIRYGNFYSYRLCEALGLDVDDGVVRASMLHYNTPDEVDRLIEFLDGEL